MYTIPEKKIVSTYRLSPAARKIIDALAKQGGITHTAVIETAVRNMQAAQKAGRE